ncbi:MetS family NSS transporter small subunit [Tepiditoga spiralis]|nr:MetS family NSS transporter small subunit [Tepiditoga spiralis]
MSASAIVFMIIVGTVLFGGLGWSLSVAYKKQNKK